MLVGASFGGEAGSYWNNLMSFGGWGRGWGKGTVNFCLLSQITRGGRGGQEHNNIGMHICVPLATPQKLTTVVFPVFLGPDYYSIGM